MVGRKPIPNSILHPRIRCLYVPVNAAVRSADPRIDAVYEYRLDVIGVQYFGFGVGFDKSLIFLTVATDPAIRSAYPDGVLVGGNGAYLSAHQAFFRRVGVP